jgi:LysR family nitrogen assimilation transcriptional regulator
VEIQQLQYFMIIAESGAFSRAAIRLATTQPILSRQIKALEQELDAELFYRTGRGVILSEAGKVLEQYARGILETTASAKKAIQALGAAPVGQVIIGMPSSVAVVMAVDLVQEFRRAYPSVSLKVMEGYSGHVLEWLTAGRIDIAVLYDAPSLCIKSLATDPLLTDELFLIGPVNDPARVGTRPVSGARLAEIPLILPSRPHGIRVLVDEAMAKIGACPNVQLEIDAMHSMLTLAEKGLGYTVLSYSCVRDLITANRVRIWPIVKPTITRSLVIASATQRPSTKPVRALTSIFRRKIQSLINEGRWAAPSDCRDSQPHTASIAGTSGGGAEAPEAVVTSSKMDTTP